MRKIKVVKLVPTIIEIDVNDLTDVQRDYVEVIEKYKMQNCKCPTIREICDIAGINSTGTAGAMVGKLKLKGYDYKEVAYKDWSDDNGTESNN